MEIAEVADFLIAIFPKAHFMIGSDASSQENQAQLTCVKVLIDLIQA